MGGPWEDYGSAPQAKESGPWNDYAPSAAESPKPGAKIMDRMDDLARSQGYKDYSDQNDKIGQGVMGGQISALAGPAISGLAKLMRTPSTITPALAALNKAAPAVAEGAPEAGSATVEAAKNGLLELAKKHPLIGSALAASGAGAAGLENVWHAVKHSPELAAALGGVALASPTGMAVLSGVISDKLAQEETAKGPDAQMSALKGANKWAMAGFQNLLQHDSSGALTDDATIQKAFASPKIKDLFVQASDLKPGSKAMQSIYGQIQTQLQGGK